MRLRNRQKEIIAYALQLHVEEMANDSNKALVIQMLSELQEEGIWGNEDGLSESFFPKEEEEEENY